WFLKSSSDAELKELCSMVVSSSPIEADDQAIQTILLGLPEDIYAAVDSCETAQEIWLQVQQMMKGSDIGIQEKKAKLFNEWERFTSNEVESIESYYHRFLKLMNDLKKNKHFLEKIASNLKFLNNLQPERSRHVTIIHQTKDLHTADYTQLYDFLKYNQKEVDELKAERLRKIQDPLALMANSINRYASLAPHQDLSPFNQNYLQQPMPNPEDIIDSTTAMNMALSLMAKAFKLNYSTPTNNNHRISSNPRNRQIAQPGMNMGQDRQIQMIGGNGGNQFRVQNVGNQNGLISVQGNGNQNQIRNGNIVAVRAEGNAAGHNENQIRCYNFMGIGHFTRDYIYTELLEPIPESHQVPHNDNDVISEVTDVEQEAAKFVGDFKSLAKEADASLAKHKILDLEIKRLLKAVVSQDIISVVQNASVVDTPDLQTELECMKERLENCIIKKETEYAKLWNDCNIYKNANLRTQLFKKVSDQKDNTQDLSKNTKFAKQPNVKILPKIGETNALSKPVTSNSVSTPQVSKGVNNAKVIAPGMFRISPDKIFREAEKVPNTVRLDNTKTRRPQPRSDTKNDRVPSASKSSRNKNKEVKVEEQHRNLLLCKKNKHISSACNNSIIDSQDPKASKPKNVGTCEILATPKPRKPRFLLRWPPTGKLFNHEGKLVDSSESKSKSNGDNACTSNVLEPKNKRFPNSTSLLGRLSRFVCGASIQVVPSI
nr:hypothetical protein [Tanacetum cinerariifolium]